MTERGATMSQLVEIVTGELIGEPSVRVDDVTHDSRNVRPGSLFVAVRGFKSDGHDYIARAVSSGAVAVCVEVPVEGLAIPQMVVEDSRAVLAHLAAAVHHWPARSLRIAGITGTNGKTTVAHLLESICIAAGLSAGRIGTTGACSAGRAIEIPRTTPEATDFQRLLGEMVADGVEVVAAEVSSHAMELGRVDQVVFDVVAFTNLSQDHLDFHGDMESYFSAKASLFNDSRARRAVINVSDPYGRRLEDSIDLPTIRVGTDLLAESMELSPSLSRFNLVFGDQSVAVEMPLAGSFNVSNALVAAGCALALDIDLVDIRAGLAQIPQIPGRFEVIPNTGELSIVVDYAHTPDGVEHVIETARSLVSGSVIVVLGAGGDRDAGKRPAMGEAASAADRFFLTSDNPRSEPPEAIIAAVAAGVDRGGVELTIEPDRRAAIRAAIDGAGSGDIVLVLGKGHEPGQEIGNRIVEFDDRVVAAEEYAASRRTPCSPC